MKYLLTISFLVITVFCYSQSDGYVIIDQDQRIEQLVQKQKEIHSADNTIDGFRIQIFMESGNDAVDHANQVKSEFETNYPDVTIYLVFGQPYYRLRVGDFRTRLEAEKFFQVLSKDYKKAFVTSDRIQLPYNVFCDPTRLDLEEDDELLDSESEIINSDIYYEE